MKPRLSAVLAFVAGGAMVLGFAPYEWWPVTLLSVGALFALLERSACSSTALGFWFTAGKFAFGTSWVYVSINVYGHAPPPLAAFLVLLMVLILAGVGAGVWWVYGRVLQRNRSGIYQRAGLFIAFWCTGEWLMTWAFSGFPWLYVGYTQLDTPLAAYAPLGGVLLVSGVAALCAVSLAVAVLERKWLVVSVPLVLTAAALLLQTPNWTHTLATKRAALVQGNTPQATKWQRDQAGPIIRNHLALSETAWGADLVVWPEAAITVDERNAEQLLAGIDRRARQAGSAFVTGLPVVERAGEDTHFYNAAVALGLGEGRYIKQHLVPFGEFVPFEQILRGAIRFFDLPMSGMSAGADTQPALNLGGYNAAMLICYEIAFPALTRREANDAELLITISNDTWFGESIGPAQHMQISRMRALENGRWLLRATNNGITAIVDHEGRITSRLPQFEAAVLQGEFETRSGLTPYQRVGEWLFAALLLGLMAPWLAAVLRGPEASE